MENVKKLLILLLVSLPVLSAYGQDATVNGNLLIQGSMGVGFNTFPANKLEVDGTVRAKEVIANPAGWPDFVFEKDYKLPSLTEVETHIETVGRLPGIPSTADIAITGVDLIEINTILLQKIEELTLYIINQNSELDKQDEEIISLKEKLYNR